VKLPLLITASGLPSWQSIAGPTHVSYWCRESFHYFTVTPSVYTFAANADYGIKPWREVCWAINGFEGHWKGVPAK
jgi:hypothetical protein